ncbi:MAG: NAD-dependent epimerase/dehydratase family protein [Pseudomonadota bacterium]|nr:NAD-dependent epimerase/dehydratase family protein [Pseudomonadota bacterium]
MARILVIGVGQIGSELGPVLVEQGHEVVLADRLPPEETAGWDVLEKGLGAAGVRSRWQRLDVLDTPALTGLIRELRPDVTYHLAALLSATGEKDPDLCWRINVDTTREVMSTLSKLGAPVAPRLIVPSSIAAFGPLPGQTETPAVTPDVYPMLPTSMYGITKVVGELLGSYAAAKQGVDFRGIRFPGLLNTAPPGGGSSDFANLLYFAAAEGKREVEVFCRPDTTIPFMYMPDAIRAITELAAAPAASLSRRTYNVAAMSPSAADIAAALAQRVGSFTVRYVPDFRQAILDSWPRALEDAPARADWGWKPRWDLAAMTDDLLGQLGWKKQG